MTAQQATRPTPLGRADWLRQALGVLAAPGSVVELRCPRAGPRRTISGYFNDMDALTKAAARLSGTVPGVYLTLNPCDPALLARCANRTQDHAEITTGDRDIVRRRWLPIDLDPVRPTGIGSTDEEHGIALARAGQIAATLAEQGWPEPVQIDSGNGAHLLYCIDEPNDAATTELVQHALAALAARFDDERAKIDVSVFNAARIWKLPGTLACKGDSTPDRPHRLARILEVPERPGVVARDLLERLAAEMPKATEPERILPHTASRFDLPAWLEHHGLHGSYSKMPDGRERYRLERCPFDVAHGKDAAIFVLPSGAVAFKCLHNGCADKTWAELRERFEPGYRDRQRPAPTESPKHERTVGSVAPLPFRTACNIAALTPPAVPWLAAPWIASGAITELDGKIKSAGKTTFALALCRAVLEGAPFMGRPTMQTNVVYLTEQAETSLLQGLQRGGLLGATGLHVLCWHQARGRPWPEIVEAAVALARRVGAGLLVVDTIAQWAGLHGDDENASGPALAAMAPLQEAAGGGLAVLILRHDRKSGGEVGDSARGSSAFSGAVDVVLALRRGEGNTRPTVRLLHALSRFSETPDSTVIELGEDGRYVLLGDDAAVAAAEARRTILDSAPATEASAATLDSLQGAAGGLKRTVAQQAVRALVAEGALRVAGLGKRGDPFRYWMPPESPAASEKVSAGYRGVVAAERNGDALDGPERFLPQLRGVPAESNGCQKVSAGTAVLSTAERNGSYQPGDDGQREVLEWIG